MDSLLQLCFGQIVPYKWTPFMAYIVSYPVWHFVRPVQPNSTSFTWIECRFKSCLKYIPDAADRDMFREYPSISELRRFRHLLRITKCSVPEVFCTLDFKICPQRRALVDLSHLTRWLRTHRFSEPTFQPSRATNQWKKTRKNTTFRDCSTFSPASIFYPLTLFLLTLPFLWLLSPLLLHLSTSRKFDF